MDTKPIIRKWYRLLEVPGRYDQEFEDALETIRINEDTVIENYDLQSTDGARNFLAYLYMCEDAQRRFQERGIDQELIIATLKDIWGQADRYYFAGKSFYLGELDWLSRHLKAELFKLGRLQFAFGRAMCDSEKHGLHKGEPVMEVHIDVNGKLDPVECDRSFEAAEQFFPKYFPDYPYRHYTCESWILGSNVEELLSEKSNLRAFRDRFDILFDEPMEDILKYTFRWNTTRENVKEEPVINAFSGKVKEAALQGKPFFNGYGVIDRKDAVRKNCR